MLHAPVCMDKTGQLEKVHGYDLVYILERGRSLVLPNLSIIFPDEAMFSLVSVPGPEDTLRVFIHTSSHSLRPLPLPILGTPALRLPRHLPPSVPSPVSRVIPLSLPLHLPKPLCVPGTLAPCIGYWVFFCLTQLKFVPSNLHSSSD